MKALMLTLFTALGAVVLSLQSLQVAAKGGPPTRDAPATSTILDMDANTGTVFRIGSDSLGSYKNGVDSVESIVQGIGNWELDTKISSLRKVRVDLGDQVVGTGPAPPFQSAVLPVRFISKCTTSIFTLVAGQTITCPLAMSIDYNGTTYALRADAPTAPGTDPVLWTCNAASSGKCVSFTMIPSVVQPTGERKIKMQLIKISNVRKVPDQPLAQYYMSFDIRVTTP
jgi:hypothetical protein